MGVDKTIYFAVNYLKCYNFEVQTFENPLFYINVIKRLIDSSKYSDLQKRIS